MLSRKHQLIAQLLWDTSFQVQDVIPVLEGKVSNVGYINKSFLFKRSLESYSWFTLLELFTINEVKQLLNQEIIHELRSKALQKKYTFMYDFLQKTL